MLHLDQDQNREHLSTVSKLMVFAKSAFAQEGLIMSLLVRLLLFLAAPITALFVARDTLNFDIIQTMVATVLVTVIIFIFAFWPFRPKPKD